MVRHYLAICMTGPTIKTFKALHFLCRSKDPKFEFCRTNPRTSRDHNNHNNALLRGVRRHILKFARMRDVRLHLYYVYSVSKSTHWQWPAPMGNWRVYHFLTWYDNSEHNSVVKPRKIGKLAKIWRHLDSDCQVRHDLDIKVVTGGSHR